MIRRQPKQTEESQAGLDISSLIDVSFLLLIYFLATSTLDPREGDLEMTMPDPEAQAAQHYDFDTPIVTVSPDGQILLDSEVVEPRTNNRTLARLEDRLITYVEAYRAFGKAGGLQVELEVDDSVNGQRFIDVMNCFAGVGIQDVKLVGFGGE